MYCIALDDFERRVVVRCLNEMRNNQEEEQQSIGVWGQRHLRYIKQNRKVLYFNLLTSGKLNGYFADLDKQAGNMFFRIVKQMAEREGVTEQLKAVEKVTNI